jgi:putative endonuclease
LVFSRGENPHLRGVAGERAAEAALTRAGLTILARRFRCRRGEIDLVARDGPVLVFVEVKRRAEDSHGTPAESVDARKRGRLAGAAAVWLSRTQPPHPPCRFDVVEVRDTPGGGLRTHHLPDAFRLWRTG